MSKIRVLIVDDSSVYRKILDSILRRDPQIEVVGTASNGKIALEMMRKEMPDVVVLDLEMPEMDGLETLDRIREEKIPVASIVFSSHSHAGAKMTLDALEKGAFDFLPKPKNGSFQENIHKVASSLISKIKLCYVKKATDKNSFSYRPQKIISYPKKDLAFKKKREAVAIGSSTGGPNALKELISRINPSINVPIFIVQHMPPVFTAQLAERLNRISPLRVKEAENGERVYQKTVYIAPGDYHMEVKKEEDFFIKLHKGPPENNCRPSVDVLFRSMAQSYGEKTLAIVLTGMGSDGYEGAKLLKEKGAYIVAQDEKTSIVWGMPRAIAEGGLADKVAPIEEIADIILKNVKRS